MNDKTDLQKQRIALLQPIRKAFDELLVCMVLKTKSVFWEL